MSGPHAGQGDFGVAGTWAILVAAGEGLRLRRDRPKAFVGLGGRPLLAESLERLEQSDWIEAIVVAAPPAWEEPAILLAEELVAAKVTRVVTGGATRSASVRAALAEVDDAALAVVVHDAARPLLTDSVLERVLAPLAEGVDGVVPVLPVSDTVKRVERGRVVETIARDDLVVAQTPQAFRADALRAAFAAGADDATDCSSLVERRGGNVRAVDGDPRLLKVTTSDDLALVERWLQDA
ncbi:MAG TPA: 2-C-methyl-D-erythritol 4-phosphate cytidylyltransferase [Gaiella sp.]|jgi:2-C-methyl-D-erythritol 4-phosphate cytidylyltransferase